MDLTLWLKNGTGGTLSGLRARICVMLKGAQGYAAATNDNKRFGRQAAAVGRSGGGHWLVAEWERCGSTWGNPLCPCLHADPVLPDCAAGETVELKGRLWLAGSPDRAESREQRARHSKPRPRERQTRIPHAKAQGAQRGTRIFLCAPCALA